MQNDNKNNTCNICRNRTKLSKLSQFKNSTSENPLICAVCRSIYYRWFQKIFKTLFDVVELKHESSGAWINESERNYQDLVETVSNKMWDFFSDRSRCVQLKTIQTGYCRYVENRCCGCKFRKMFLMTDAFPKTVRISNKVDQKKVFKVNDILVNYKVFLQQFYEKKIEI